MAEFWLGIVGVVVGFAGTLCVNWCQHRWQTSEQRRLDEKRKVMLSTMLMSTDDWRKLETLSRVIGADYATTTRLLIELGARGSEREKEVWALQSRKPLS